MLKKLIEKWFALRARKNERAEPEAPAVAANAPAVRQSPALFAALKRKDEVKKTLVRQGILAGGTVALIVVLLFAMTAAWFTNISKTGSLTFTTESWGFDENNISINNNSAVTVRPGMSGIVPLSVDNSSGTDRIRATVTTSTKSMGPDLQQRIFFYVPSTQSVNDELVSRVYISSEENAAYSYDIMPGDRLLFSTAYYTDAPLRWMWVYDMLGYYFLGTVDSDTDSVGIQEYLRPIEYDLDMAVFGVNGGLQAVGDVDLDSFLQTLSGADGYAGQFGVEDAVSIIDNDHLYYPVAVDEEGSGVWAYLCTKTEVDDGIAYDSSLVSEADVTASVTVVVQNITSTTEKIASAEDLRTALSNDGIDVVQLTDNIELTSPLFVSENENAVLDLNGFRLSYSGSDNNYSVFEAENAELTVMNGTITGNGQGSSNGSVYSAAVYAEASNVTLSNVTVSGFDGALVVDDSAATGDSVVKIIRCNFDTEQSAISIYGNNDGSEAPTRLVVQDSVISSGYVGVIGNGTDVNWGTETVLIDSEISGLWAALYQPQSNSTALISGCTLSGYTGLAVKGGTVTVSGGTITGTGAYAAMTPSRSGWCDTGDGVYVEAYYPWSATLIIKDGAVVSSEHAHAVGFYGAEAYGPGQVLIYDGLFTSAAGRELVRWTGVGILTVMGGNIGDSILDTSQP